MLCAKVAQFGRVLSILSGPQEDLQREPSLCALPSWLITVHHVAGLDGCQAFSCGVHHASCSLQAAPRSLRELPK
jgi:hypothetical protein